MSSIFHEMTEEELDKRIKQAQSEIRELRFNYAVARSLQDPDKIGRLKKDVARCLTVKKEREKGIATIKEKKDRKVKRTKTDNAKKKEVKTK